MGSKIPGELLLFSQRTQFKTHIFMLQLLPSVPCHPHDSEFLSVFLKSREFHVMCVYMHILAIKQLKASQLVTEAGYTCMSHFLKIQRQEHTDIFITIMKIQMLIGNSMVCSRASQAANLFCHYFIMLELKGSTVP